MHLDPNSSAVCYQGLTQEESSINSDNGIAPILG